jgi:transposase
MNYEQPKCGDDCKLVEMLATKSSKEQAMENAIAAVQTGNISQRGAAKRFGVKQQTLSDRLKKASGDVTESGHHATQECRPARTKPTDEERQEWWRLHTEEGLTANAIHKKTGRNRETITKEIRRREEAKAQPTPTPAPTPTPSAPPEPTPTPSVPIAGNPISKDDEPITPTGKLNKSMKIIVKRERISGKIRMKAIAELSQLKEELEKTWTTAQRERTKLGASIHAMDVKIAEKQLVKDGETSICKSLTKIAEEAEAVRRAARQALYHLHFVDMP